MSLTPNQESNLVSGGNCFEHFHLADREMSQSSLHELDQVTSVRSVSGAVVVKNSDDILLVDTSAASVTVPLPVAKNGRVIEIIKTSSGNRVIITTNGADLVFGSSSVFVYNIGTALRFKAIPGGWVFT